MQCQFVARTARVMTMATTIEQAIRPLLLTYSILGLGIYSQKRRYLSIFYNVTVWIVYGCLCYYTVTALKIEIWFQLIYNMVHVQIGIFAIITSVTMGIYQGKRFRIFMKRLAAVDDTLEALGTSNIYRKLHVRARGVLIGWLVCSHMANVFDMVWWAQATEDRWCMIIPYITNHYHHVNMFVELLFMTFLWYIGTRFDKINEHMRCLLIKKKHELRRTWRETTLITRGHIIHINNYKRVLWTSMHLHLEICQIARELNELFGPQLTVETIIYLVYLIRICNIAFKHIQSKGRYVHSPFVWVGIHFWASVHVTRLFSLNYICESVSAKANEIEGIIHQLTDSLRYADVREEIYQFTLQIIHHPLRFTGLGLFYFGNGLLRKFIMTIATFVIIIMQMSTIPKVETDV